MINKKPILLYTMEFDRDSFATIFDEKQMDEIPSSCSHNFQFIDGSCTCIDCGIVDVHRHAFTTIITTRNKSNSIYHRKSYFREKLKLMIGIKQSQNTASIISQLKNHKFNSIIELKKLMNKLGHHKYYKYIYSIYHEIKGVKLISLSHSEIDNLTWKFLMLEKEFKKQYPNKSNLLSYNIVIYSLLKKVNHPYYKNIILPKNKRKLLRSIEKIVK